MTLSQTMSAVDYAADCELEAMDNEQAYQDRIAEYIAKRAKQIHEQRMSHVSDEDFIIGLEAMQTLPTVMHSLKKMVYSSDAVLASVIRDWIDAMLRADSYQMARAEAHAKFLAVEGDTRH